MGEQQRRRVHEVAENGPGFVVVSCLKVAPNGEVIVLCLGVRLLSAVAERPVSREVA